MRHSPFLTTTLAALIAFSAAPSYAGTAEAAFLAKLAGTWTGGGQLTGADNAAITCKLVFKPKSGAINFSGKCDAEGLGMQNFTGVISYNDKTKKYEAAGADQTAVGIKSGGSVVFTTKLRTMAGIGNSVMKVAANKIVIDVEIARGPKDALSKSHMILTK